MRHSLIQSISRKLRSVINNADLLGIIFPIAMVIPNVVLDITENICIAGKIANIIVPLSIYCLLMSSLKRIGLTILLLFIFILMNMFQNVVLHLYGESIIAVDMLINIVTTDPAEASELLSNLAFPIIINAIIYVPLIAWAIYALCKKLHPSQRFRDNTRKYGLIGLATGILFTILALLTGHKYSPSRDLYPFNVISNMVTAVNRIADSVGYDESSKDFIYNSQDTHPAEDREIYLLVIGETCRVLDWELYGYDRPTNPMLSKRDDIAFFKRAVSQSNTTHKCVPLMITPVTTENFDSLRFTKSIVTAFSETGYATAFFSTQAKNHSYIQYFGEEADTTAYLTGKDRYDHNLVALMKQFVDKSKAKKQFIILHTYGSHFNYRERYTPEYSHFKPDEASQADVKYRDNLINAYDNTILYTDAMLNDIISYLESTGARSVMIYTSDHGEDIFDDSRERVLHSSPVPTYYQLRVPMVVWTSESYDSAYPDVFNTVKNNSAKYVAPTESIFFTLLDVAGIKTAYNDPARSLASEKYREPKPLYLNDLNESVPLGESGLKDHDIELFKTIDLEL